MDNKKLVVKLGFLPKENAVDIFVKRYMQHDNYALEIDFAKQIINYGKLIKSDSKTTQNFAQAENWVILECVDRLLDKGYKPKNIVLEKIWPAGHGTSGRLDICVNRGNGSEYLMIECKTYGKEYDKALAKLNKDGGQLFTYFNFSRKADVIMLYTSELKGNDIVYKNNIIKIEDDYRSGDVKDFYDKWNKLTKDNGIFDNRVKPYCFESKALTVKELEEISQEDSSFIFNQFLEILRHNVVSDKPNAFNKIFTLFLCKIYDEKVNESTDNELAFQWLEGVDDDVSFQLRLADLYKESMWEFLEKRVTDFSEDEFDTKYKNLDPNTKQALIEEFTKIRLQKNNEFAIKEVYDEKSFKENAKVVKQVVELLQKYKIRYAKKQQYLSDFFELLLTTGLKQESGQFFTPVPIAQFILKSLPIDSIVRTKLEEGKKDELLPYVIDYAAGSGHFITESMHEIQRLLNKFDTNKLRGDAKRFVETAKISHFDWALRYIYGIEKDYRLVKVGKVGCYLHGDGLANVIHSDGLADFSSGEYKGKLKETDRDFPRDNKQFDIVVSNPPYSVSSFKNAAREYYGEKDFELYNNLTDNSSEIECLFVERTKQLLKDGGVAGIILPSPILSNTGICSKTREIILQYFEIIAVTELGSNTFMATNSNTIVLFLRRRNNYDSINLKESLEKFFINFSDVTMNGVENPVAKYVEYVWEGISFTDYITLLKKSPNKTIEDNELYKEYRSKIKAKRDEEFWDVVLEREKEKLHYFILVYNQEVTIVKTSEKNNEKNFLGYEFSNRRGNEGIHPIKKGKTIDDCTSLFDTEAFDNPLKASTYIYKAFNGDLKHDVDKSLSDNISYTRLIDMLTLDRADFEKIININAEKKVTLKSKFKSDTLGNIANFQSGLWKSEKENVQLVNVLRNTNFKLNNGKLSYDEMAEIEVDAKQLQGRILEFGDIILEKSGGSDTQAIGRVALFDKKDKKIYSYSNFCSRIRVNDRNTVNPLYLWVVLHEFYKQGGTIPLQNGVRLLNIDMEGYKKIKIPLPPICIQEKIVEEIEQIGDTSAEQKSAVLKKYL